MPAIHAAHRIGHLLPSEVGFRCRDRVKGTALLWADRDSNPRPPRCKCRARPFVRLEAGSRKPWRYRAAQGELQYKLLYTPGLRRDREVVRDRGVDPGKRQRQFEAQQDIEA